MAALVQFERDTSTAASIILMTDVFSNCWGRSKICIGGCWPGFDWARNEVFVKSLNSKTIWMPAGSVLQYLSIEEHSILESLPKWDGSNEYHITSRVLRVIEAAIGRYRLHELSDEDSCRRWFRETIVNGQVRREYLAN
jgi:hypothetical protein